MLEQTDLKKRRNEQCVLYYTCNCMTDFVFTVYLMKNNTAFTFVYTLYFLHRDDPLPGVDFADAVLFGRITRWNPINCEFLTPLFCGRIVWCTAWSKSVP